jgi:hypothetical protein
LRHEGENADDLGLTFHSGEIDHTTARGEDAVVWAMRLKNMAGQVVILMPAGNYLLGWREGGIDKDERGIVFKESASMKPVKGGAEDFDGISLACSEEIGQSEALGAKPGDAVGIVLDEKAAHG